MGRIPFVIVPWMVIGLLFASDVPADACQAAPYECAMSLVEREEYGAAVDILQPALAQAPRDLRLLNLLGIALTGAGRIEDADARFRQALAIDAAFQPARKNLAVNQFNQGRLARAERLFQQVLADLPEDEVAHLHLGEIEYARKNNAAALKHYEKSGARVMAGPAWMLHYAGTLLAAGHTARAITVLNLLPRDDADTRFEAGVELGRAGAYREAASFFGSARNGYRDPQVAGYNQTLMLVEAGDHGTAIEVAEDLVRRELAGADLYNLASRAYLAAGRIQEAYDALRTATRLEPSNVQHYVELALICVDHENYELGIEIVDIGLQYQPESAALHLHRGVLLVLKGMVKEAEPAFERARALTPRSAAPPVALAMAWMQTGRTDRAVELLRREAEGSRDAALPYMFGIALVRSGVDPSDAGGTEAMRAFEAAVRLDGQMAGARAELGKILLKRGDVDGAIAQLERAMALDADDVAAAYSLAQAYRRSGRVDQAQAMLSRVSALNARQRGDDPDRELKRLVVRIVREGAAPVSPALPAR